MPGAPYREIDGLYFKVIGPPEAAQAVVRLADDIYQRILADTKLTDAVRPYSLYPIYLYRTGAEYFQKSGMPEWSGAMFSRGSILTFDQEQLAEVLAHEIAHLVFFEFFGGHRDDLLWLNEGLAMLEESRAKPDGGQNAYKNALPFLKGYYLPLAKLTTARTALDHKEKEARIFYVESWLLVNFLMEQGGRVGFYEFLKNLKAKKTLDQAVALGFPGKWASIAELETSFRAQYSVIW